jgi:hypothetical protein
MTLTGGQKDDEAFANFENLLALAKRPNIAVKASALPCYTSDSYPYRRLHPRLRQVYDAFGPRRIFWGTDITRLPCTYSQAISMITEAIPWLTAEDKEWIMEEGSRSGWGGRCRTGPARGKRIERNPRFLSVTSLPSGDLAIATPDGGTRGSA